MLRFFMFTIPFEAYSQPYYQSHRTYFTGTQHFSTLVSFNR